MDLPLSSRLIGKLEQEKIKIFFRKFLWWVVLAFLLVFGIIHAREIIRTAIDIPFMDEWVLFDRKGIVLGWSKDFLLGFINEHRSLATKILLLLNYELFGLNFRYQIIINLLLFFGLLVSLWILIVSKIGGGRSSLALLTFVPLVSNLLIEVHTMAFIGGKHLYLMSLLWGTFFVLFKRSIVFFLLGTTLLIFTLFSYAGATVGVFAIVFSIAIIRYMQFGEKSIIPSVTVLLLICLAVIFWYQGYYKPNYHPPYTFPWTLKFWRHFAEVVSLGFGFTDIHFWTAIFCTLIVFLALGLAIARGNRETFQDRQNAYLIVLTVGILSLSALVSFGRAEFPLYAAKASRYAEISALLPMLSMGLFNFRNVVGKVGCAVIGFLLLIGNYDQWDLKMYDHIKESRLEGQKCVREALFSLNENSEVYCKVLFPFDVRERIQKAQQLGVSFTSH